ncbi:MAG: hypothetical protein N2663_09255 [Chlorobi bacterium]|nr:hypothetical protein [Chlorobiota bacterium]
MKKATYCLLLALGALAMAQPIQVTVTLRTPAPGALPIWASDPTIVQVSLRNTTATLYDGAVISFLIRRLPAGTTVARSKDFHPLQPRITVLPNSTLLLTGPQIIHESAVKFEDEALRQQAQASGQLPEGEYEFCMRVLDAQGREIGTTGAFCPRTLVMLPDPPMLINPRNDSALTVGAMPMFQWAPVAGSAVPVTYTLRVVPLFPGQAPQDALTVNAPVLNLSGLAVPLYQYVPTDIPFTAFPQAIGFVWQVSAVDVEGRPATRNNGKSEIFRFRFASNSATGTSARGDTITVQNQSNTLAQSGTAMPVSRGDGNLIRRIAVPHGLSIVLRSAVACTSSTCTISGSGSLYLPILHDSIHVAFSNVTVRQPDAHGEAPLVSGMIHMPIKAKVELGLLTLAIEQLSVTPTAVTYDGAWLAYWSKWDWSCRTVDSVPIKAAPFYAGGIPRQIIPLPQPWICNGDGLLIGPCVDLRFDTLDVGVVVDTMGRQPAVVPSVFVMGEVAIPCIVAGGSSVNGRFAVRADRREDLLTVIRIRLRDARVLGMQHLRFDADTLILDLSSQANPRNFPPDWLCANAAGSEPRWRGVYVPSLRARFQVGDDTVSIASTAVLEQGNGNQFAVSIAGVTTTPDTLRVGSFGVHADSISVHICQSTLQSMSARGVLLMPPGLQRLHSWGGLDSIETRLAAYDDGTRWRWNATLSLPPSGLKLHAGQFVEVALANPSLETIEPPRGNRYGYIEFGSVAIRVPASNIDPNATVSGLRIWNTGDIDLTGTQATTLPYASRGVPFDFVNAPNSISTLLRWGMQPILPLSVERDSSLLLHLALENTGTESILQGMPFDLRVWVYIELPQGGRQLIVEQQRYILPRALQPKNGIPVSHSLWLPKGGRLLGIRVRLHPCLPTTEGDGEGNNTIGSGQLPPFSEVGR